MRINPDIIYLFPWAPGGRTAYYSDATEIYHRRRFGGNTPFCHVFKRNDKWHHSYSTTTSYSTKEEAMGARDAISTVHKDHYLIPENEAETFYRLELLIQ